MEKCVQFKLYFVWVLLAVMCNVHAFANQMADSLVVKPRVSVTQHAGVFNGTRVNYTATVKETFLSLKNKTSTGASIISASYVMNSSTDHASRPVMFIFNGGPGASSSPLHMHALGPYRIVSGADHSQAILNNPLSPLDVTDMVFIDPVGTGYTVTTDSASVRAHWDVEQDASAVIDLIKTWMQANNRANSPIYICGQSYGTTRAAEILGLAPEMHLAGVLFLSAIFDRASQADIAGNDMTYLLYLPTMASVGWYHHKAFAKGETLEAHFNAAVKFSQNEYAAALMKGSAISSQDKQRIAARLAELTGLTSQQYIDHNLRINYEDFKSLLLAGEGKRLGELDGRISTTVKPVSATPSPYNDPSFASTINTSTVNPVSVYFKDSLRFPAKGNYVSLNLKANFNWKWTATNGTPEYWTVAPYIAAAMQKQPGLRLFVAGGYFDLATPIYGTMYTLDHVGADMKRITWLNFPTGHDTFDTDEHLKMLTDKLRSFVLNK